MRFSGWRILREGLRGNTGWQPHWRDAQPKAEYDAIIIGGGGHGLSTAYYLAKEHGMTNIAVLEKGYLGGGNVGRNTTIVRANYFQARALSGFREHAFSDLRRFVAKACRHGAP